MRRAWLALLLAAPLAQAADVLASGIELGDTEARLLVRAPGGSVRVTTEPAVLAGGAAPGALPPAFEPTPLDVHARHTWRGLEGVVEIVLRRETPAAVDVFLDDGEVGAWVEWPAADDARPVPSASPALLLGLAALASRVVESRRRGSSPPCGTK